MPFTKNDPLTRDAGRKGGRMNVERYGVEHLRRIGDLGGQITAQRGKAFYAAISGGRGRVQVPLTAEQRAEAERLRAEGASWQRLRRELHIGIPRLKRELEGGDTHERE